MSLNIRKEQAALDRMTIGELRERFVATHGEATRSWHKDYLIRKILWRLQALDEGDLTERARKRAAEIASDADLRLRAPPELLLADGPTVTKSLKPAPDQRLPAPGSVIAKDYKGRTLHVTVLERGFEFEGERYRSLSAIAKLVTGTSWNGWAFFGVKSPHTGGAS